MRIGILGNPTHLFGGWLIFPLTIIGGQLPIPVVFAIFRLLRHGQRPCFMVQWELCFPLWRTGGFGIHQVQPPEAADRSGVV